MSKDWTQPICRVCFVAFNLGLGRSAHREPTRAVAPVGESAPSDPCMVCGDANEGIYVRVDPALTEGLHFAQEKRA